jgi:hypothetical protein
MDRDELTNEIAATALLLAILAIMAGALWWALGE